MQGTVAVGLMPKASAGILPCMRRTNVKQVLSAEGRHAMPNHAASTTHACMQETLAGGKQRQLLRRQGHAAPMGYGPGCARRRLEGTPVALLRSQGCVVVAIGVAAVASC